MGIVSCYPSHGPFSLVNCLVPVNLQASPCIRFHKEGILLAVSTNDNNVKILANSDGVRLLRTVENASRAGSAAVVKVTV